MKKIILPVVSFLIFTSGLSAFAADNSFMGKTLKSWISYPLDSFIYTWGYPDEEDIIANKNLYYYYHVGKAYAQYPFCTVIIEADSKKNIVGFQHKGNQCPFSYLLNKNLVNPKNDPWKNDKQRKLENKRKRAAEKQITNNKK